MTVLDDKVNRKFSALEYPADFQSVEASSDVRSRPCTPTGQRYLQRSNTANAVPTRLLMFRQVLCGMDLQVRGGFAGRATGREIHATEVRNLSVFARGSRFAGGKRPSGGMPSPCSAGKFHETVPQPAGSQLLESSSTCPGVCRRHECWAESRCGSRMVTVRARHSRPGQCRTCSRP